MRSSRLLHGKVCTTLRKTPAKFSKMPRIIRQLPPNRADYSFGDLIYWHFFVYGTRPNGDPKAKKGREWELSEIRLSPHITEKTLNNWITERHLPDNTVKAERMLFGNSTRFDDERLELAEALRKARASKARQSQSRTLSDDDVAAPPAAASTGPPEASASPEQAVGESGIPTGNDPKSSEKEPAAGQEAVGSAGEIKPDAHQHASGNNTQGQAAHSGGTPAKPVQVVTSPASPNGLRRFLEHNQMAAAFVTAVTVVLGMYAWSQRPFDKVQIRPSPAPAPPQPPVGPRPPVAGPTGDPPPEKPPAKPRTEQEIRAEQEKRNLAKIVETLKANHDRDVREREEEAKRLDREGPSGAAARAQREREWNEREVAGMGYRLLEYNSVNGTSMGQVQTETVFDCALSCLADKCDAFAWFRDERTSGPRTCFRYKAPLNFYDHPGYTAGKKISDLRPGGKLAAANNVVLANMTGPVAQATPSPPAGAETDAVTHCPNGPVKVSGFKLSCDVMLVGGTTLGSNRLSWTVTNINECARKCEPIKNCVGFTFNAAQQGGHSCVLFGPTPETRDAPGWISGER